MITDPPGHARRSCAAAHAGVAVFCQKPMAPTLPECEGLVETCRDAGVPFADA